jgi:hypothetical protein
VRDETFDDADALTWRTLANIDSSPAGPLTLGMIEPDAPNLIYAAGGVGKGSTLAWMIRELLKIGRKPIIYDPENRPREWARRCSGLGVNRSDVVYVQPKDLPTTLLGEPLWNVMHHIGKVAKAARTDFLLVDSIIAGMNIPEDRLKSDARAPYQYVAALDELGITSVSTGHTPRATPDGDPYGSVSWVNAMRLTWLGTPGEGEGHRVRWRPRKRNERGHIPGVLLHFQYQDNGLVGVDRADDEEDTRHWLMAALRDGARTVDEMAQELTDTLDDHSTAATERARERLGRMLRRMAKERRAERVDKRRGSAWKLTYA